MQLFKFIAIWILISVILFSTYSSWSCWSDVTFPRSIPRQRREAIRSRGREFSARTRCETSKRHTSRNQSGFGNLEFRDCRHEQSRRGVPFRRAHANSEVVLAGFVCGCDDLTFYASLHTCGNAEPDCHTGTTWDPHANGIAILSNGYDRARGEQRLHY